jgi:dipeptidase D
MKITDLEPKLIWQCFDEITKVPRPTHHLKKMEAFLVDWAHRHNIPVKTDEVGNVVMTKPATPGYENAPTVILQGHQDMVAEKRGDKEHDFFNDPITTIVDGDWVKADGTTLGADNGLGCATAMAVLLDDTIEHGPIEAMFTVDEEQGLIGANGLQPGFLKGTILLNLDSEEHGQLVIGCAGGMASIATLEYDKEEVPEGFKFYRVTISHLKGGHSGMEINLGRGNANQIIARFLWKASEKFEGIQLSEFNGGGLPNAIPREATAVVGVWHEAAEEFEKFAKEYDELIHAEYIHSEGKDFTFTLKATDKPDFVIAEYEANDLFSAIFSTPNGVQGMSRVVEGLVETSCNLASVKMVDDNKIEVTAHFRSSVDSRRDEAAERFQSLYQLIGCEVRSEDIYTGWAPNTESNIVKVCQESFRTLFGKEARVEALHAGLECGLFLEKMPGLDMVSFGPTLKDIHSPNEKANIPSVQEFWVFVKDILRRLK